MISDESLKSLSQINPFLTKLVLVSLLSQQQESKRGTPPHKYHQNKNNISNHLYHALAEIGISKALLSSPLASDGPGAHGLAEQLCQVGTTAALEKSSGWQVASLMTWAPICLLSVHLGDPGMAPTLSFSRETGCSWWFLT